MVEGSLVWIAAGLSRVQELSCMKVIHFHHYWLRKMLLALISWYLGEQYQNVHDPMILTVSAVYILICILHSLIFLISRSLNNRLYTLASIIYNLLTFSMIALDLQL